MTNQDIIPILGFRFKAWPMEALIDRLENNIRSGTKSVACVFVNPHSIVSTVRDQSALEAINSFELMLPDGSGIMLASKILGTPMPERITGPDMLERLTKRLAGSAGASYFFMGASPEVLDAIRKRLEKEAPSIRMVGAISPPFGEISDEQSKAYIDEITEAKPDCLWVGMTAPKQEKWIYKHKTELEGVPVIGAIGAAFDFYSGTKKRSGRWFREHGMEWLPRLLREPKRLWRRNFISTPKFLWMVFKQFVKERVFRRRK